MENYIKKGYTVSCPKRQEFHFMSYKTFVFSNKICHIALKDFMKIIEKVRINSLYLHIFEVRFRKSINKNDFLECFKEIGKNKLAKEIAKLDRYTITLEGLREKILKLGSKYASH